MSFSDGYLSFGDFLVIASPSKPKVSFKSARLFLKSCDKKKSRWPTAAMFVDGQESFKKSAHWRRCDIKKMFRTDGSTTARWSPERSPQKSSSGLSPKELMIRA